MQLSVAFFYPSLEFYEVELVICRVVTLCEHRTGAKLKIVNSQVLPDVHSNF
jgi:hypothetical protein